MSEIVCPLCGETDFDAIGFISHIDGGCEAADKARDDYAEYRSQERERHRQRRDAALSGVTALALACAANPGDRT